MTQVSGNLDQHSTPVGVLRHHQSQAPFFERRGQCVPLHTYYVATNRSRGNDMYYEAGMATAAPKTMDVYDSQA